MRVAKVFSILGLSVALAGVSAAAQAADEPVLTVIDARESAEKETAYDMTALQALPAAEFETTTIWTEGAQTFEGVYLKTLLDDVAVDDGEVVLTALNDYAITIPLEEIHEGEALLAYARNGAPMRVRDKGPLWLVYPYDSEDRFRNEVIYSRSIWQVVRIRVEP